MARCYGIATPLACAALLLAVPLPGTAQAQTPPKASPAIPAAFAPLKPLIGKTWRGKSIDKDAAEDVMRWEWALGGHAVRIVHAINGGVYGGETLVYPDKTPGRLIFHYFTTGGFHTTGVIRVVGPVDMEVDEDTHGAAQVQTLRSTATLGADGVYRTRTKELKSGNWVDFGGFDYREDPAASVVLPWLDGAEPALAVGPLVLSRRIVANPGEAGQDAAAYLNVRSVGAEDRLLAASCACADRIELHRIDRSGARPSMISDPEWTVPAGGSLDVRPGSNLHLMLMNFDPAKSANGRVSLELTFRDAGKVRADFDLATDSKAAWRTFDE